MQTSKSLDTFEPHPWPAQTWKDEKPQNTATDLIVKAYFDLRGAGTNARKAAALAAMLPIESEVAA